MESPFFAKFCSKKKHISSNLVSHPMCWNNQQQGVLWWQSRTTSLLENDLESYITIGPLCTVRKVHELDSWHMSDLQLSDFFHQPANAGMEPDTNNWWITKNKITSIDWCSVKMNHVQKKWVVYFFETNPYHSSASTLRYFTYISVYVCKIRLTYSSCKSSVHLLYAYMC